MNANDWDQLYSSADLVWTADANKTLVAEVAGNRHVPAPAGRCSPHRIP